jgi:excisionase family DNA binding protein
MDYLTAEEAAERLGVSTRRVQAMVKAGRLPSERFGRALMIRSADLALVADRKPGRPPKEKEDKASVPVKKKASKKK